MIDFNDGGTAFPAVVTDYNPDSERREVMSAGGMSLRDYFAAKALMGLIAREGDNDYEEETLRRNDYEEYCNSFALSAYAMADAMLKAREAER